MALKHWSCILLLITLLSKSFAKEIAKTNSLNLEEDDDANRRSKFFPVFQVVQFPNTVCVGLTRNGTCYTSAECTTNGGTASGTCAQGYGVCCIFALSCGGSSSANNSYLVQASTTVAPTPEPCSYKICKCSANICRIRLDFNTFQIAPPILGLASDAGTVSTSNGGGIGDCVTDSFSFASPGNNGSPVICGFNTGQHMILDASDACNLALFDIGSSSDTRAWDIKVTQYACGDLNGGPEGCLQYFTGKTGRVSSYNFNTAATTVGATATHLSSQYYTMCFRQEAGMCSICYVTSITNTVGAANTPDTENAQTSFGLSVSSSNSNARSMIDSECKSDYLIVPNAEPLPAVGNVGLTRICGRTFSASTSNTDVTGTSVCSKVVPFQITFRTDANEDTSNAGPTDAKNNEQSVSPAGIIGFSLNYVEQPC